MFSCVFSVICEYKRQRDEAKRNRAERLHGTHSLGVVDVRTMRFKLPENTVEEVSGVLYNKKYNLEVDEVTDMDWMNMYGLIFIAIIMIPNIIFAIKCKDGFENKWNNKCVETIEQVGRFGCFGFMIINIPGTWFGWWSDKIFAIYLIVDVILIILYCIIWIICFKKNSVFRALALSIIPSILFLFSGIMSRSILLILSAILFAPSHIIISYKNSK